MDGLALLKTQATGLRRDWNNILGDMTQEQVDYHPEGLANPISQLVVHSLGYLDTVVNKTAQGKTPIWDSGNWGTKINGIAPGRQDLAKARAAKVNLAALKEYTNQVLASVDAYLATAQPSDLDKQIPGAGGNMVPLANQLSSAIVTHFADHMGEISAIKGIKGGKGYVG
ncbi:MAG: DinB family protein [Dehalococcoidia bacterium]|nr:DinB family protein [Dehalococcoidia bacterium]